MNIKEQITRCNETILNHFGIMSQLEKFEEELLELLLQVRRVEEIADVENVLEQIKIELNREYKSNIYDEIDRIKMLKIEKVSKEHSCFTKKN